MSPAELRARLTAIGQLDDDAVPAAEAALLLAALARPGRPVDPYRRHLDALAGALMERAGAARTPDARADLLREVLNGRFGYEGDADTYEDLDNADLMRVIDRRRGLPVALGILYLHVARAAGWGLTGLNFPGHFLVRLEYQGDRLILDPFAGGATVDPVGLRERLKAVAGPAAELEPVHYAEASAREVVLRLQNNLKMRHLSSGRAETALAVLDGMLLVAPERPALWRECGLLSAHVGQASRAVQAFETLLTFELDPHIRRDVDRLIRDLRSRQT